MTPGLVAKRCTGCHEIKPVEAYRRNTGKGAGLTSRCSRCLSDLDRERRPEKYRPATCEPCRDRRHGHACLGVYAVCRCRCRPTLGLEGPFEFGDPTVPSTREAFIDD